jgi:hypothetical protein
MRAPVIALLLVTAPAAAADLLPLDCHVDRLCVAGHACAAADEGFNLIPDGDGYRVGIDAGEVRLAPVSPPEAAVRSFIVAGPASVTVLVSLYPSGEMVVTTHEIIDGAHAETLLGRCRPEAE